MARVRTSAGEPTRSAPVDPPEQPAALVPSRDVAKGGLKAGRPRPAGVSKRRKPEAAPVVERLSPQVRQVGLLMGLAGCTFTLVALGSYDASDVSLSVAGTGQAHNWVGPVGSYLADILYQGLGYAAWSVTFVGAFFALRLAGRRVGGWGSGFVALVGLVALAGGLDLALGRVADHFPPGGMVGILLVDALLPHTSQLGTGLILGTGLVGAATILFGINWQPIAARAVDGVQNGAPAAARAVGAASVSAMKATARLGGAGVTALRDRLRRDEGDEEEYEDTDGEDTDGEELPDDPPSLSDPVIPVEPPRAAAAVVRPAPPALPEPARAPEIARPAPRLPDPVVVRPTEAPVAPARLVDPPSRAPVAASVIRPRSQQVRPPEPVREEGERDTPTQHAGRTLVEVEWTEDSASRGNGLAAALAPAVARASAPPPREPVREPIREAIREPSREPTRPDVRPLGEEPVPPRALAPVDWGDDDEPSAVEPPPVPFRAPEPIVPPPPEPRPAADPRTARPKARVGNASDAAVLPGNLKSGGVTDDGKALRKLASPFHLPPLSLLDEHPPIVAGTDEAVLLDQSRKLTAKLLDFGVEGRVTAIRPGPVITVFEYEPAPGVKLSRIAALSDDLAMALKALSVRIVAPIPGRGVVGIEIPNEKRQTVWARDVFSSSEFREGARTLPMVLGKDTEGRPYVGDLARMPHLLIGGTTGSGKSVGVNSMLVSLLFQRTPEELRLILVDPKMLEFELYQDIPHLLHPVVTEAKLASAVLKWACTEMDERYRLLARWQTRNIESYNEKVVHELQDWTPEKARRYAPKDWPEGDLLPIPKKLPFIVIVIDELADLMMVAAKDVEESIVRLAQKARACGIHLIVATQRPSVDVITGLIKANMPSRIAYQVRSKIDGRTILDQNGAETLLGKGDLLFLPPGTAGLLRIHGPFLTDDEVRRVAEFLKEQAPPDYAPRITVDDHDGDDEDLSEEMDENYDRAVEFALEKGRISTSMIQRLLKIGYNRAARIMEIMEREGIVGPADGAKPREVLAQK